MGESENRGLGESREQAVRAELNRLLESSAFRTSKRCREFLEYIVEHTMKGPTGALKERLIGMELFQLPPDFDTGQHTVVRVTANEVRKKLAQHYLAENGSHNTVRIDLPPGSYSAAFRWETSAVEEPTAETQAVEATAETLPGETHLPARANWLTHRMIAGAVAILALAGAFAGWRWRAVNPTSVDAKSVPVSNPSPTATSPVGNLRMIAGSTAPYVDRSGRTWGPDRFFSGGAILAHPSERILRTLDPDVYRHLRFGEFQYNIPLEPGSYELHLHFAETGLADFISAESSGEGQRIFRISVNGQRIVPALDVVADAAGANVSDERVFRDISPAGDGVLHLSFGAIRGSPMLSAIELLPVKPGTVTPVRIRAGWTSSWQDSSGQQWRADTYFLGGNALVRTTNPAQQESSVTPDLALYGSERWGHFSYALPVPDGRYRVRLKFVKGHYGARNAGGGGVGSRMFDVFSNGVALLRNFDILKEAGGEGRPIEKVFSSVEPNAQGKIILTFVPVRGMACVNGIEVTEETK